MAMTDHRHRDSKLAAWLMLAAAACSAVASAAAEPAAVPRYSQADEAAYLERFTKRQEAFRLGVGLDVYEPLEPVPGAASYRPLPLAAADSRTIADDALRTARAYAARLEDGHDLRNEARGPVAAGRRRPCS